MIRVIFAGEQSLPVIEHLDALKDALLCFFPHLEIFVINQFDFQSGPPSAGTLSQQLAFLIILQR